MSEPIAGYCTACGAPLVPAARFCGRCGTPATGPAAAHSDTSAAATSVGERRQVSVLFVDLANYTRLSAALDPEETHGLLSGYFEAADQLVRAYGGTVDKHIGDAVMGVFGAPVAHDNDPERAVRAALDIRAAVEALARRTGRPLMIHAGIASGEVVAAGLGHGADSAYTVTGDAVNLAARLCDAASAGEIVVSEAVQRAVQRTVELASAGTLPLKGFDTPVALWRVRAIGAAAAPREGSGPLVGRRTELRQFAGVIDEVLEGGRGQLVYVRGEAGIGKSRLVEEFATIAAGRGFACHKGLVLDFGTGQGRDAIRSMVHGLFDLGPDAAEPARAAALARAAGEGAILSDQRAFLADLLDLPPPDDLTAIWNAMDNAIRIRGRQATVAGVVAHFARTRPRLLVIEDLHWADAATLGQLAALAAAAAESMIALVITSRIEGDPIDAAWRAAARGVPIVTLDLNPLRPEDAQLLAARFAEAGQPFLDACIARAEGNALFLLHLLRDAQAIMSAAIPDSIQSLVLARMDRLPPGDKRALQAAAVIGQRFALEALRHLVGEPGYRIQTLIEHYLVRPEIDDFLFAHALIRDGVYASLMRQTRRELHGRAAEWFADRDPQLAAELLDRAEDPRAAKAYLRASELMRRRYDYDRVLALAKRGIEVATDALDRYALTQLYADALREAGRAQDSVAASRNALALAKDEVGRARAWIGIAAGLRVLSRIDEAMQALDEADRALGSQDLPAVRAQIHYLRGNLYFARGVAAACQEQHELALAAARRAGDIEYEARALGGLGDAHYARGRMTTALKYFRACSEICRARGFGRIDVTVRYMIGHALRYHCDLKGALVELEEAASTAARVGNRLAEMIAQQSAALMLIELGRPHDAIAILDNALALSQQLGARRFDGIIGIQRAAAQAAVGNIDQARQECEAALVAARETGMGFVGASILGQRALFAADRETERASFAEGEELLRQGCVGHNYFWFYRDAIVASLDKGRSEEAARYAQALADYTADEPLPWADFHIARARALAAFGRGAREPGLQSELARLRGEAERAGMITTIPALDAALARF